MKLQCKYESCKEFGKCDGSGFILVENKVGELTGVPCDLRKERDDKKALDAKLINAKIPEGYWKYNLETYETIEFSEDEQKTNKNSLKTLKGYIKNPNDFLDKYSVLWIWGKDDNAG